MSIKETIVNCVKFLAVYTIQWVVEKKFKYKFYKKIKKFHIKILNFK